MIIGSVPYINCLPLTKHLNGTVIKLPPAELIHALNNGDIDVGLIPSFSIIKNNLKMHPDAGIIGCDGAVKSVGFFTRPYITNLSEIESLYLDKESLSSVHLAKIILKRFYGVSLYDLEFFHEDNREMADAQMLIGDKALFFNKPHYFYWDLGKLWKAETGHGFMFASWASKRDLTEAELNELCEAKQKGLAELDKIALEFEPEKRGLIHNYFTQNLRFEVNDNIKNGFKLYKECLAEYGYSEKDRKAA
ncbi:MAG: menaquinone biosynthesis protein [Deltaproteobacteria bacterium]|nr:menaquinone biosynthesis protein [Deltaproteobacteria bacterium]